MAKILVTGAGGQLGQCFKKLESESLYNHDWYFASSADLDITNRDAVEEVMWRERPDYVVNCAAYTAVDLAEDEPEKAFAINADGVENLALACKEHDTIYIHVSTDYVFDGETNLPYSETDFTNPKGVYGASKLEGEILALQANPKTIVVRTSWLYSEFSKNFVKTMLNLFKTKEEIGVVADQFGQPTNANHLAEAILKIIESEKKYYGIFHFSDAPETSWNLFAKKIAEFSDSKIKIKEISTEEFPTKATRPKRSTMNLDKISNLYRVKIKHWEQGLQQCLETLANPEK